MDYKDWKILNTEIPERQEEYAEVACWCNESGHYHIEDDGTYHKVVENQVIVPTHEEIIKQEIKELEEQITPRNLRCAIFGDEFAIDRIAQIEAQIDELRKQL